MFSDPYFWVALSFIVFAAIVVKLGGSAIIGGLDSRADRIRKELDEAQKLREDAQAALAQIQRKQRDALKEAEAIIASTKEEADRLRSHAAANLADTLKRREQQALEKIAQAEAVAVRQVRDAAVDVAIAATEKLLVQNIDAARDQSLVGAAIADLPACLH